MKTNIKIVKKISGNSDKKSSLTSSFRAMFLLLFSLALILIACKSEIIAPPGEEPMEPEPTVPEEPMEPDPTVPDSINSPQLIDISNLTQLNAIRYDLDGDGEIDSNVDANGSNLYTSAFSDLDTSLSYLGYELVKNLDFAGSEWASGEGWDSIGDYNIDNTNISFRAIFEGNGKTISNLYINRPSEFYGGLFAATRTTKTQIRRLGLPNVQVNGLIGVGGLVGINRGGTIRLCYTTGMVSGGESHVGGLAGYHISGGIITASYSHASVSSSLGFIGGLVGDNEGTITDSYTTGSVSISNTTSIRPSLIGGLAGDNSGNSITASYTTGLVSITSRIAVLDSLVGGFTADGGTITDSYFNRDVYPSSSTFRIAPGNKSRRDIQSPTSYTGIYSTWDDHDVDGDGNADAAWDFGTSSQYPRLKVDFNRDGVATVEEFGPQ